MLQPDTEEMLPRSAPKPCISTPVENLCAIVQPTVPEVSLLYNQPQDKDPAKENIVPNCSSTNNQFSYSSWKKHALPTITFPQSVANEVCPVLVANAVPGVNMYGGHGFQAHTSANMHAKRDAQNLNSCLAGNPYLVAMEELRRSVDTRFQLIQNSNALQTASKPEALKSATLNEEAVIQPSRSVLSVCASCQTDSIHSSENTVTKQEFDKLYTLIEDIRREQYELRRLLETSCNANHQNTAKSTREAETQCEIEHFNNINEGQMFDLRTVHTNRLSGAGKTPCSEPPIAQSTVYQKGIYISARIEETCAFNGANALPNPSTENSFVMNELARKYIPPEKITELMQDTCEKQIAHTPTSPLQSIENINRRPSDISNASYQYLHKYHLLSNNNPACYQKTKTDTPTRPGVVLSTENMIQSPTYSRPSGQILNLQALQDQPKYL